MYVMRTTRTESDILGVTIRDTLTEMTAKELRQAEANARPGVRYRQVSGQEAHRFVRDGGHHETPLYVEDGRIRYARDSY